MTIEQPELYLVRLAHECMNKTSEYMENAGFYDQVNSDESSKASSIFTMAVPNNLHELYKKKFELYREFKKCAEKIEIYVFDKINIYYFSKSAFVIPIPLYLHHLLQDRYSQQWEYNSRIEVFENLRTYLEHHFEQKNVKRKFEKKMLSIGLATNFLPKIKYMLIVNFDESDEDAEQVDCQGYVHVEIHPRTLEANSQ